MSGKFQTLPKDTKVDFNKKTFLLLDRMILTP